MVRRPGPAGEVRASDPARDGGAAPRAVPAGSGALESSGTPAGRRSAGRPRRRRRPRPPGAMPSRPAPRLSPQSRRGRRTCEARMPGAPNVRRSRAHATKRSAWPLSRRAASIGRSRPIVTRLRFGSIAFMVAQAYRPWDITVSTCACSQPGSALAERGHRGASEGQSVVVVGNARGPERPRRSGPAASEPGGLLSRRGLRSHGAPGSAPPCLTASRAGVSRGDLAGSSFGRWTAPLASLLAEALPRSDLKPLRSPGNAPTLLDRSRSRRLARAIPSRAAFVPRGGAPRPASGGRLRQPVRTFGARHGGRPVASPAGLRAPEQRR